MTTADFLTHFAPMANTPGGVQKLRNLILQLAVQGKLVEQDPNDEPAAKLLAKIARHRASSNLKKSRKRSDVDAQSRSGLHDIPPSWEWSLLGDLGITQTGTTPKKADSSAFGNDYPFIKPGDIFPNGINYDNEGLSKKGIEASGRLATQGSVLMVCIGTIGKCNVIDRDCSFNQQINAITLHSGLVPELINLFLRSPSFQKEAWRRSSSTTISILNKGKWESIPVPVPPLAEQRRIVAKVDELMRLCDALEAQQTEQRAVRVRLSAAALGRLTEAQDPAEFAPAWRRLSSHFDTLFTLPETITQLRQTLLQLAVMGQLVPQNPNDEPAAEQLSRITKNRNELLKAKEIGKPKPIRPIQECDRPFDLPTGWEWSRFGNLILDLRYGTSKKCAYELEGVPVLRIPNIANGRIDLSDLKYTPLSKKEKRDLTLQIGDLLLVRSNGSESLVGRSALVEQTATECAFAGYLVRARTLPKELYSPYLQLSLDSLDVRRQIEGPIRTTSGVKNINSTEISNLLVPVPPLAEQHRIVQRVQELMALCDTLETQLTQWEVSAERVLEAMIAAILDGRTNVNKTTGRPRSG